MEPLSQPLPDHPASDAGRLVADAAPSEAVLPEISEEMPVRLRLKVIFGLVAAGVAAGGAWVVLTTHISDPSVHVRSESARRDRESRIALAEAKNIEQDRRLNDQRAEQLRLYQELRQTGERIESKVDRLLGERRR